MRPYLLVVAIAMSMASCDTSGISGPEELRAFARAKARWDARPFESYVYEIRTFCFCPPEVSQWTRVVVREGAVVSADPIEPDYSSSFSLTLYYQSIDSLFSRIHEAMTGSIFNSAYGEVVVDYDEDLGYPEHVIFREGPGVADAGSTVEVRHVQPLFVPAQAR